MTRRITPGEDFAPADGQFVLKDLMAGMPLQVTVSAPGYRRQVLRRVVAQPSAEAGVVQIELKTEDPAKFLTIRGTLTCMISGRSCRYIPVACKSASARWS